MPNLKQLPPCGTPPILLEGTDDLPALLHSAFGFSAFRPSQEAVCRAAGTGLDLEYVVEAERGIPAARNRALETALARGADAIAFIDDDEVADSNWLAALIAAWRGRALQLVGGPVAVAGETRAETAWQRLILSGVRARLDRKARAAALKTAAGTDGRIVIVTNNWLIDAAWLRAHRLRFDESRRFTGGTDTLFFYKARAAGIVSGWAPDAVVRETIPPNRLTYRYQLRRARDQATGAFNRKYPEVSALRAARSMLVAAGKAVGGAVCFLGVVVAGGTAVVQSARMIGGAWGIVRALNRHAADLYATGDGG